MSSEQPRLIDLFQRATAQDLREPDFALNIEIADRMNTRRRLQFINSCLQGIEYFKQLFKSSDLKTIKLTLTLLQTCVKNCQIHFHRYINSRNLMPSILQLLKRKRKKLNMVQKLAGLYKRQGWRQVQNRVLSLIQLWADTFMMHQDKYPIYMKTFRSLSEQGLKFPIRDPNQRFMINYQGEPSPAFQNADMQAQFQPGPERDRPAPRNNIRDDFDNQIPQLLKEDILGLQEGLPQLEELIGSSRDVKALQEIRVKEVVRRCRLAQKKLIWVVSYKTTHGSDQTETLELLQIMDFVNAKMESFKAAARLLKNGASESAVRSAMDIQAGKKTGGNLLDQDFLQIPEAPPLQKLEKYVFQKEEKKEEEVLKEEVKQEHRLQEPPDLLFEDEEIQEPSIERQASESYDLTSIMFDSNPLPVQAPIQLPQGYQQAYFAPQVPQYVPQPVYSQPGIPYGFPQQTVPQMVYQQDPFQTGVQPEAQVSNPFDNLPGVDDFFSNLANRNTN